MTKTNAFLAGDDAVAIGDATALFQGASVAKATVGEAQKSVSESKLAVQLLGILL